MGHPPVISDLDRLRLLASRNPGAVIRRLRVLVAQPQGADTCMQWLMLAELLQRTDDPDALNAVARAAESTSPADLASLVPVLAVNADLAISAGRPDAPHACEGYLAVAKEAAVDPRHLLLAEALGAVAAYHYTDCRQARSIMAGLVEVTTASQHPYGPMLMTGLAAMHARCRASGRPQRRPAGSLPPMPGGALHPHLDVDASFASFRVQARFHRCPASQIDPPTVGTPT